MDKNKLKKIATAIAAAGLFNCFAAAPRNAQNNLKDKNAIVYEYNKEAANYNSQAHLDTLSKVLGSELRQMKQYDWTKEADVNNEVAALLEEMNANSLRSAHALKSLEDKNFAVSNLTEDQVNRITAEKGQNTPDSTNLKVIRMSNAHVSHMGEHTVAMVRSHADKLEIKTADEGDNYNEYYEIVTDKRGTRQQSTAVLSAMKNNMVNYAQYEYEVTGKGTKEANRIFAEKIATQIATNLNEIETLAAKSNFTQADYNKLVKLIKDTAKKMPKDMFGSEEMVVAYLANFAAQHGMNRLLTVLATLGYDIENILPGVYIQQKNTQKDPKETKKTQSNITMNPSFAVNVTDKHVGTALGLTAEHPLAKDWSLAWGGEVGAYKSYKTSPLEDSLLVMPTIGASKTFNNDSTLSFGGGVGAEFNPSGTSMAINVRAMHEWMLSDHFSIKYGIGSTANFQRSYADVMATFGVTTKTKNWKFTFSLNLGYTATWNKNQIDSPLPNNPTPNNPSVDDPSVDDPTIEQPTQPTPPVYDQDKVVDQGTSQETPVNRGDDILPEKDPGDLSWYRR